MAPWQGLLDWWFGPPGPANERAAARTRLWFGKREHQDAEARERFAEWAEQARSGGLDVWCIAPQGWLALILLLDQLPRMIHRDQALAYAGDQHAQTWVVKGLAQGWEQALEPLERVFIYLVLEHAEDHSLQAESVARFAALHDQASAADRRLFAEYLDYALRHQQVITRFSRFPHRNAALGRLSSDEERAFLKEPGSRF